MEQTRHARFVKFAGLCGIVGPVVAISMMLAAVAYSPRFTWQGSALSDLGVYEAAALFNGGVVIAGVLSFVFALGLRSVLKPTKPTSAGIVTFIVGGVFLALVGIFTEAEATSTIHMMVSMGYFVSFPVALLLLGWGMIRHPTRTTGLLTIVAGAAALAAVSGAAAVFEGMAIPEMLEVLILAAWVIAMSAKLIAPKHSG